MVKIIGEKYTSEELEKRYLRDLMEKMAQTIAKQNEYITRLKQAHDLIDKKIDHHINKGHVKQNVAR